MPISRMMPISAIRLKSKPNSHQDRERADAGRGQRRQDRQRVDVALVENAEDQVDHDQRGEDQQRHGRRAIAGTPARCPGRCRASVGGAPSSLHRPSGSASVAWPSATPCARLKLIVTAGNWPWWLIDSGRTGTRRPVREGRQRHLLAGRRRLDIDLVQRVELALQLRQDFEDDVIAVELGEILRRPGAGRTRRTACRRSVAAGCRSARPGRGRSSASAWCRWSAGRWRRRAAPAASASSPRIFGAHSLSSARSASCSVYWNWVRVGRPPSRDVLRRLHEQPRALDLLQLADAAGR